MIVRILGEGQYTVADDHLDKLNQLDAQVQRAADAEDEERFAVALRALLDAVRTLGTPLPDQTLEPSELVLPEGDMGLAQVRALLSDEGLIPG
ncbi:hypothetical protein ITI46_02170 [Streptomyces oryzae]|uniref:PspA-associated domain-containing protein n=1 Tax=Streptomyces oryzae TaxID=1434886 RepID=A0ABS3X5Y9_9ACTN|nr:hypothetical protein [Streptomyces oryzae]MBO8190522.1 hypothetical protein [Streptomyces oryzae]